MKTSIKSTESGFKPIELKILIESKRELDGFNTICNHVLSESAMLYDSTECTEIASLIKNSIQSINVQS